MTKTTKFSKFFSKIKKNNQKIILKLKKKQNNHSKLKLKEKINMDKKQPIYEIEFSKEFGELSSDYEDEDSDYKGEIIIKKPIFIISDEDDFSDFSDE